MADLRGVEERGQVDEEFVDGLCLGDAIRFFLDAKRAGGRSERTLTEYRKKLDLFQRWAAGRLEGDGAVDAPASWVGPDEVEGYVVHMRERGLSDSSIKNHLSVVRSFFDTLSRRLDLPDPTRRRPRGRSLPVGRRTCCSGRWRGGRRTRERTSPRTPPAMPPRDAGGGT